MGNEKSPQMKYTFNLGDSRTQITAEQTCQTAVIPS
jgi:hypothetical protein